MDRDLQQYLLNQLAERYPGRWVHIEHELPEETRAACVASLCYLEEHELVVLQKSGEVGREIPPLHSAKITAKGLDFLSNDGGLSAILGTVTVRLHADTIRDLIEARITESEAPQEEKRRMVDALKAMPEEGLKHLTTKLIDYGLGQSPGAWQALASWLS